MPPPQLSLATGVLAIGLTYRDLVVAGVKALPQPGEESYADGLFETWGGISNMARVCRRLGMDTALCTAVGDDDASDRLLRDMAVAGIDTSLSLRHNDWDLPVTVALSLPHDRAMVTVEKPPPAGVADHLDSARLDIGAVIVDLRDPTTSWLRRARRAGTVVYASRGFDPTGSWGDDALQGIDECDVWMLNEPEARAFTGEQDALAAARELSARVPLVIVTRGAEGMVAVDRAADEEAEVAAFPVTPQGTTGAGDTTLAAFVFACQFPGRTLAQRLELAAFIVSAALARPHGAGDPPTLAELLEVAAEGPDPRLDHIREALRAVHSP